ncbi:hypothetical protein S7711_09915 [Stachybotrys chartarum IBT 7711]|uniref:DUF1996 domain-containing protein n=1 Tax=Stachybotrys chartarum (strain CBS 109288 / IBT 7711) TaxID=1280523 RepID=A0A084AG04_STACB|nr:hypothetical protein S7711_09915 [Stachybotrys chartarum IBT 7711]
MKFSTVATLAALAASASAAKDSRTFAVLRFTNKQLTKGRMDPIVSPGKASPHVHTIMGGSGFSWSATGEDLVNSECSNTRIKGDNSAYWFPSLYFKDPNNGSFEAVEVFYVNAYYFFEPTNDDIKAFPVGLQMISGDTTRRTPPEGGATTNLDPSQGEVQPIKFTCPRSNFDPPSWPADSDGTEAGIGDPNNKGEGVGFPDANCDGYASPLRADVHFPSCYNPEAGLTDQENNMAFPTNNNGKSDCPEGWIHVPHLFLEVYWNTPEFVDRWEPLSGHQPFVLSNGDATGYGSHADFMAGWDEELLQHIIDTCDAGSSGMDNCPGLFYGTNEEDCTIPSQIDEQVDGVLDALPGSNVLRGWSYGLDGAPEVPETQPPVSEEPEEEEEQPPVSEEPEEEEEEEQDEEPAQPSLPASDAPVTEVVENPVVPTTTVPTATSAPVAEAPVETPDVEEPVSTSALPPRPTRSCSTRVHTVWETVTVTGEAPVATEAADPYAKAKREHIRRHHQHHHL